MLSLWAALGPPAPPPVAAGNLTALLWPVSLSLALSQAAGKPPEFALGRGLPTAAGPARRGEDAGSVPRALLLHYNCPLVPGAMHLDPMIQQIPHPVRPCFPKGLDPLSPSPLILWKAIPSLPVPLV